MSKPMYAKDDKSIDSQDTASSTYHRIKWVSEMDNHRNKGFRFAIFGCLVFTSILAATLFLLALMTTPGFGGHAIEGKHGHSRSSTTVPQYFQTSPQIYAGPTKTADIAPFLAQTNAFPIGTASNLPNVPLATAIPIQGNSNDSNIFQLMGHLSPYFPNPTGFGVDEYPLPPGANITHAHLLSRHGSRYPTAYSSVATFGDKIMNLTRSGTASWTGALEFLNTWRYTLGSAILVHRGRQELFESGVLFWYNYGALYDSPQKLIARTTTQDRMLKSAEYFMTGMFGFDWPSNVTLEPIIEQLYFNNSLAGYYQCNNTGTFRATAGNEASRIWENTYLANATQRLRKLSGNYEWSVADSYFAQTLCPYETVAFGYSEWCSLFTYEEWEGFEYSVDLQFQGDDGFMSPMGRGIGIGFVEEFYARLQGHVYDLPEGSTNVNTTLSGMEETFPTKQKLYMDFSHDTNIYSIMTAFGLRQFSDNLSNSTITPNRNVTVSHITPFGARVVWEEIDAPHPVKAQRPTVTDAKVSDYYEEGGATSYIHMTISQRTVPFGESYPECGKRDDGWCERSVFMNILSGLLETARYEYSCFGDYPAASWGNLTDGVPVTKRGLLSGGMGSGLEQRRNSDMWYE